LLRAGARDSSVVVLPAHGLVLDEVGYPPAAELAARAQRARRFRGETHASPPR
ncbi:MAG: tRNA pseudouridine(38-40) synthase TruA, partial [Actinomycetota bacterium]|nr:tRNA pseudouridine(38-40) synthase TruA [Actinomycetota bacterium]